jgi:hypothetical protein
MDLKQRETWNENHKILTEIILKPKEHYRAIQLFLSQHALLHSSVIGNTGKLTLDDEVFSHSGNNMSEEEIAELSSKIDFDSLLAYRAAVGKQTRQVVSLLKPGQFKMKVEQNRIKRLFDENAVTQNANWLADYWSKKSIAGLILMPATRHNYLHLNKCVRIKDKFHKQMKNPL